MKNKYFKTTILFLSIAGIMLISFILVREPVFMDPYENRYPGVFFTDYGSHGSFKFNPETILEVLDGGKINIFAPITEASGSHIYSTPFLWKQSDYLMIASALHQFVWKETTENWNVHDMSFDGGCQYNPIGFDIVMISYYKITGIQKYDARMIGLYPMSGEGEWGEGTNYPRSLFERWDYIDLKKLKVFSEDALQIAEDNGGKLARLRIDNKCRIRILLGLYPFPNWKITYSNKDANKIFEMTIDPYTGKVLTPNK